MINDFYKKFEDRFRGSRDVIKGRLEAYLPFIKFLPTLYPEAPALDLGCGRGEWMELLKENGFSPQGVDLDEAMHALCLELGFKATLGNAITFLQEMPSESQAVISGFHLIEHIPFEALQLIVKEAKRVLLPGGILILETPNSENILVASSTFYLDPTHDKPIPDALVRFLCESEGYGRVKILGLNETRALDAVGETTVVELFTGVSPDYGLVAQKSASAEILAHGEAAFEREIGVGLVQLGQKYFDEQQSKYAQIQMTLDIMRAELTVIHESVSWQMTKPFRLAGKVIKRLFGPVRG